MRDNVAKIKQDSRGFLWFCTSGGVSRFDGYAFTNFTVADGLPNRQVNDFLETRNGEIWLATNDGLVKLNPKGVRAPFDINQNPENPFLSVYLPENSKAAVVHDLFENKNEQIFAGTGRGLDRLNPATGQIENFTTADGLPNGNPQHSYRDRKNNLWFITTNGLARFVPEPPRERQSPTVLITGLRVSGVPQLISVLGEITVLPIELNSDQRQVTIDFLGLGASLGERLKYEYRFSESDWTQTAERTVNFANLASGAYQFEVRAQTADRIYSEPALVSFRIAAPLWQRWWFILGVMILTESVFYWLYRFRLVKLLEIERTRTRIATDLHDDIGTNLSKIALLSEIVNMQLAGGNKEHNRLLNTIAETSRESVAAMSDIVWTISPKSDSMLEMTHRMRQHAEEFFVEKNVRLKFNAPDNSKNTRLSMEMRREIYLIFKEAVNNA